MADNPGHQHGAAECIRLGMEYGAKCGHDFMIHTSEDVIPKEGALALMARELREGYDYVGGHWEYADNILCSQFFGLRCSSIVAVFDPYRCCDYGYLETYLWHHLQHGMRLSRYEPYLYLHSHDYDTWKRTWSDRAADYHQWDVATARK